MTAIITLAEVKTFLQITGTVKDALITALIPEVQGWVIEYCNRTFLNDAGDDYAWPAGIKLPTAMAIGETMAQTAGGGASIGLTGESQGGYSYTKRGTVTKSGYSEEVEKRFSRFRFAKVGYMQRMSQTFDRRGQTINQMANGGYYLGQEGVPYEDTQE